MENSFEEYLKNRFLVEVEYYENKSKINKNLYVILKILSIILSCVTPVIISLKIERVHYLSIIMSSMVAILTSVLATFKLYENWINYRTTCESLKKEKYYYKFGLEEYTLSENKEKLFVERVEYLISTENTKWFAIRSKRDKENEIGRSNNTLE